MTGKTVSMDGALGLGKIMIWSEDSPVSKSLQVREKNDNDKGARTFFLLIWLVLILFVLEDAQINVVVNVNKFHFGFSQDIDVKTMGYHVIVVAGTITVLYLHTRWQFFKKLYFINTSTHQTRHLNTFPLMSSTLMIAVLSEALVSSLKSSAKRISYQSIYTET